MKRWILSACAVVLLVVVAKGMDFTECNLVTQPHAFFVATKKQYSMYEITWT